MKTRYYLLMYLMLLALAIAALFSQQPDAKAQSIPPTPTVTHTPVTTDTPIPPTATNSPTAVPSLPATFTPTAVLTTTATASPTASPTTSPTVTQTATPVPSASPTASTTPSPTATATSTPTPAVTVVVQANAPATLVFNDPGSELVTLQLPAGAVTSDIVIKYTPLSSVTATPTGFRFGNIAFTIDAFQSNTQLPGFTFAQPVLLTIQYNDADIAGLDESHLVLRYFDPLSSQWLNDGITVISRDNANNRIVIQLNHLTQFALFEATIPTASEEGTEPMFTQKIFLPWLRQ